MKAFLKLQMKTGDFIPMYNAQRIKAIKEMAYKYKIL